MSHLDEGTLHALLDGEIASTDLAGVERHLAECPVCRGNLEEARAFRDEAFGMIEALTPPVAAEVLASPAGPVVTAAAAPANPAAGSGTPANVARRRPLLLRWARPVAWAATTVLAVGLGYTIAQRDGRPADRLLTEATPAEVDAFAATQDEYRTPPGTDTEPPAAPKASVQSSDPAGGRAASAVAATPRDEAAREQQAAPPPPRTPAATAPAPVALKAADELRKDERANVPGADRASSRADSATRSLESVLGRMQDSAGARQLARRRLFDTTGPIALNEVVVTTPEPAAKRPANSAGAIGTGAGVTADSAIRRLGGAIRLVEGLTPLRYEIVDSVIRVAYQTSYGLLFLDQWREDGLLRHRLVAPRATPADSLAAWEERIR